MRRFFYFFLLAALATLAPSQDPPSSSPPAPPAPAPASDTDKDTPLDFIQSVGNSFVVIFIAEIADKVTTLSSDPLADLHHGDYFLDDHEPMPCLRRRHHLHGPDAHHRYLPRYHKLTQAVSSPSYSTKRSSSGQQWSFSRSSGST